MLEREREWNKEIEESREKKKGKERERSEKSVDRALGFCSNCERRRSSKTVRDAT